jgi:hypothetical protein
MFNMKEYKQQYRLNHLDEIKKYNKQYRLNHKNERKQYELNHKNKRKKYKKQWRLNNKDKIQKFWKQYYLQHKNKKKEYWKQYRLEHKKERNKYIINKYKIDTNFKMLIILRSRLLNALKNNSKSKHTLELIGCNIEQLKKWLQYTAINNGYLNFNINNYSCNEFEIDHIIPCSWFNLSDINQQKDCFHYKNMQILSINDHNKKHS